jgi:hypothetical protein
MTERIYTLEQMRAVEDERNAAQARISEAIAVLMAGDGTEKTRLAALKILEAK